MPTQKQLAKLLRLIEHQNSCKVIGFIHDEWEPFYKLDIYISANVFQGINYLFGFHFDHVDFVNRTMRFLVFDDEMEETMKTVDLTEDPADTRQLQN